MDNKKLSRIYGVPGAVVNTDNNGLAAYRKARNDMIKQQKEYEQLKSDVADIKSLLQNLLEKIK